MFSLQKKTITCLETRNRYRQVLLQTEARTTLTEFLVNLRFGTYAGFILLFIG
jgi:hypothetical protein